MSSDQKIYKELNLLLLLLLLLLLSLLLLLLSLFQVGITYLKSTNKKQPPRRYNYCVHTLASAY